MASGVFNRGSYTVSGIAPAQTGISENFQAGLQANLNRQDVRSAMDARAEQARLARNQDRRAQTELEMRQEAARRQQAAAAASAARAAQQRAALQAYTNSLTVPTRAGVAVPTASPAATTALAPTAPPAPPAPPRSGLDIPGSGRTLSFPTGTSAATPLTIGAATPSATQPGRTAGVQVATTDPNAAFLQAFEARPDVFSGVQVADATGGIPAGALPTRTEFGGTPFDVYPDGRIVNAITGNELPDTEQFFTLRRTLIQQTVPNAQDALNAQVAEIGTPEAGRRGPIQGAVDYFAGRVAADAAAREAAGLPPLPTAAELGEQFGISVAEPASPAAAAAEAPTTAEEAAPTVNTSWGGLFLDLGTPVQLSFGETNGRGSQAYVADPDRIFQDAELAARQRQRLEGLATFYQQTGDATGLVGVIGQIEALDQEQRYLDGMVAIVGVQRQNFGPAQQILQSRYPGQQVELRPYTDGTLELFVDGERAMVEGTGEYRPTWDEFAEQLRGVYDTGYISQQQALAAQQQEMATFAFQESTKARVEAARDVVIYEGKAEVDRALDEGELVLQGGGDTGIGNMVVDGRIVAVNVDRVVEGKGDNQTVRYVVRRIGTGAVE